MKNIDGFNNETDLEFTDISNEIERHYIFPNGTELLINNPLWLNVSKSGGHRIKAKYNCYYVKPSESWYIRWTVEEGKPDFVN